MTLWILIALYLALINLVTFAVWRADKRKAVKRQSRIRESTLLTLCALGGWPGAIVSAQLYRHKTSKLAFIYKVYFVVAVQIAVLCCAIVRL